ncbi:MAG: hypothetical protein AB7V27_09230 [Candidatus Binatia bacterium]
MRRNALARMAARVRCAAPLAAVLLLATTAHGVRLVATDAQVSQPGEYGQICVVLDTGGLEVAGTQNDLVWDGSCATLDESNCSAAGSHGKQALFKLQREDFRMRALVLSLANTNPIGNGQTLYCCNVQSEAAPGSCCAINLVAATASDPSGNPLGAQGSPGRICTAQGGRGIGSVGSSARSGPLSASNAGVEPQAAAPAAEPAPAGAGSAPAAPPAAQVLPGGGARAAAPGAPQTPAGAPRAPAPAEAVPGQPATPGAPPAGGAPVSAVPPATLAPALAPVGSPASGQLTPVVTAEATAVETAASMPTPPDTATPLAPTVARRTSAPASTATAAQARGTGRRGPFGCEIGNGESAVSLLLFAILLVAAKLSRRWRTPHT